MSEREAFAGRLDAVETRLAGLAVADARAGALTEPDPGSGERWEAGQVWAHMAEFVPYWMNQVRRVIDARDAEPVAFGRTKHDAERNAAIARDRSQPVGVLWNGVRADIDALRRSLDQMDASSWTRRGLHPTIGVMSMARIIDEFLVGHLEQHAAQLESLQHFGQ
ncbi:MAG: DinB family protein [Chloroflexi bacterium]|nr:MAG: DinB family protein [Chloroflexota bacterium]